VKPGAALPPLPPCDHRANYWTPEGSLSAPLARGDWAAVEGELEELHASFVRNRACENRMLYAFQHGFWLTEALPEQLDRWVAARPQSWTAYVVRGSLSAQQVSWGRRQRAKDAVADLERAIQLQPSAVVAYGSLIVTYRSTGETAEMEKAFRRGLEVRPVSVHVLETMITSFASHLGNDVERVKAIVAEARTREKENPRVARLYGSPFAWHAQQLEWGRTNEWLGTMPDADRDRVIVWYTRALRHQEPGSEWHYRRASAYRDREAYAAAIAEADFALAKDDTFARFWVLKVFSLGKLARYDEALAVAREGRKRAPDSVELRYTEGNVYADMGNYAEAVRVQRAAADAARKPHERAMTLRGLGYALVKSKRYAEAVPVLQESVSIESWHALTFNSLAEALWETGRRDEAIPVFEHFLGMTESKPWFDKERLRAQERIDGATLGAQPPARGAGR